MPDQNDSDKNAIAIKVLGTLFLLMATVALLYFFSGQISIQRTETAPITTTEDHLIINEVSSNKSGYISNLYGENFDWIELYNPTSQNIDLSKYYLSDKEDAPFKYQLPEIMLVSKAFIIVYASGYDIYDEQEIHANFKISSKGEMILLSNAEGTSSTLEVPEIDTDFSYGQGQNGTVGFLYPATPMQENGDAYAAVEDYYNISCTPNGIYINEYMSQEQSAVYDEDGYFSDWAELVNTTDADVSLKGYCLTDDPHKPYRFVLPDVTLEKHSTILIFLDGKDIVGDLYTHANFALSMEDDSLNLFDSDHNLIDTVKIVETDESVSYGRDDEDINLWQYFRIPTPNQPNIFDGAAQKEALFIDYPAYVLINEVKSISSGQNVTDEADWIELYNNSSETISLADFGLSDSKTNRYKWVFPKGASIAPKGYLLVLASGNNAVDAAGNYNTNFKLDAGLEEVYLTSNLGYVVDKMPARYISKSNSFGKSVSGEVYLLATPTPGVANAQKTFSGYTQQVNYSNASGVYSEAFSLELSCDEAAAEIYYTLDGTIPTKNASKYTEPITVNKDINISAIAVSPNKLSSDITCQSYILEREHDLPIVAITCDPDYLYGSDGLFVHISRDKRVPATIKIIEPNNGGDISFEARIGLFGNTSLYAPQKSFAIEVDQEYGNDRISYDLFPGDTKTSGVYGTFVVRNGGSSEWNRTKLTDAFLIGLARLGMNVDAQAYRPCAVYINGKYYGLLNIREKLNRDYIEAKYGFAHDDISIVEPTCDGEYGAVQGDVSEFMAMVTFIRKHDLSDSENYEYIESQLDIDCFIDSVLAHIISGNKDTGNIKFWRADVEGQKWRVLLFDLDRAAYYPSVNHLEQRTSIEGHGSGNLFDTSIIRGLLENKEFAYRFYKRAIELIDTLYSPEFSTAYYDYLVAEVEAEMDNNLDKWWEYAYNDATPTSEFGNKPKDRATAERFILDEQNRHRTFLKARQSYMLGFLKGYFNLSDGDFDKIRQEIAAENKAPTQIFVEFVKTGSIEAAIAFANQLETAHLEEAN